MRPLVTGLGAAQGSGIAGFHSVYFPFLLAFSPFLFSALLPWDFAPSLSSFVSSLLFFRLDLSGVCCPFPHR